MSRTILFYNVYITFNGDKTDIKLTGLIDRIYRFNTMQRFWNEKNLSLFYLKLVDNRTPFNRSFAIAKYRDNYRPYIGTIGTNQARPINEDVIEFTCCSYIDSGRILMIEYNHFGCRNNDIAKYLSSFLPKIEGAIWDICLEPIESTDSNLVNLRRSTKIKSIELNLDCTQNIPETLNQNSFFTNLSRNIIESHQEFGANVATFKFSNGKKRNDIINVDTLIQLVTILDTDSDVFISIKVKYLNQNGKEVDTDLKNGSIMKEYILENNDADGYEFIIDTMEVEYINRASPGSRAYTRFRGLVRNLNLPALNAHDNEVVVLIPEEGA